MLNESEFELISLYCGLNGKNSSLSELSGKYNISLSGVRFRVDSIFTKMEYFINNGDINETKVKVKKFYDRLDIKRNYSEIIKTQLDKVEDE